jgi:hypothetical protein
MTPSAEQDVEDYIHYRSIVKSAAAAQRRRLERRHRAALSPFGRLWLKLKTLTSYHFNGCLS